ncbi:helix-turn-helix domain-containing protein [Halobaculum sp. MBLA0143]|uniref:helix-turn-helix domain-containing protein n=1 Tax=Halobaculum sp. MBLA0143 TaxID=3079933 RepID=UPI003524C2B7
MADTNVVYARFRIALPPETWVCAASEAFPDATFRLLAGVRSGDTAQELGEVQTTQPAAVEATIRDHPAVSNYEALGETDNRLLGRYETTDVSLYGFLESSELPPEFPVVVRDGDYELDVTVSQAVFDRFVATLQEHGTEYELLSKLTASDRSGLLTARQREVLSAALRHGYLDVPRECTLAELAGALDADPSSVSTTFRRAQRRLATWFLAAGDTRHYPSQS